MGKDSTKLSGAELLKLIKQLEQQGQYRLAKHFLEQYKELRRSELSEEDRAKLDNKAS